MKYKEYDGVMLITNKYKDEGFYKGMRGTIMYVYDDAYEVDFTNLNDNDSTLFMSFHEEDLILAE